MSTIPLLIVSGPIGVGKTSVAEEVSNILVGRDIPHTLLDLDCLGETYPRPDDDPLGMNLMLANLESVWKNCVAAGSKNLVLARVIENDNDKNNIIACIPNSRSVICQLKANDDTLIARIRKREIGSGVDWHERRSLEMSASLTEDAPADHWIDTDDRSVVHIANEIVGQVTWQKL